MIVKVDKGTELADRLLDFVNNCSWDEAKAHIAELIRTWDFKDWETMFALLIDDKIAGMASVMKTDYYPLPDVYPWVSCVFVSEEYRGHKLSGELIAYANDYLKARGFERSYIPSAFTGLYEQYGYTYIRDIVNYGGETDHLFMKEFSTESDSIYITGDTHADFRRFGSDNFDAPEGSKVIICGDFGGIWQRSATENYWLDWLENKPYTFLFVDGNHENFDRLYALPVSAWNGGNVHVIRKNIIHLMRGQIFNIDGIRFFTFGGARSHDISDGILSPDDPRFWEKKKKLDRKRALYRIEHTSWWKEELPSEAEMEEGLKNLEKAGNSVDFILSHCAPTSIQDVFSRGFFEHDMLTDYLETVLGRCSFKVWFFGHYHDNMMIGRKYVMLYEKIVPLSDFLKAE